MNLRRTAIQETNYDRAVERMKTINFAPLNKVISELVGIPIEMQFSIEQATTGIHPVVNIFSETDVKDKTGFLKDCFEKVFVQDFGATLFLVYEADQDEIDACIEKGDWSGANKVPQTLVDSYLHLFIDARIHLKTGGSNGLHLLSCKYNFFTGEWHF